MTSSPLAAGLLLIHGNHPEELRDLLVSWMRRHPLTPLESETILVQSSGMAQWLRLALAQDVGSGTGGCGIAAGLDLSLPSSFLWDAYRAVLGADEVPEESPFDEARLVWRLMRLLPQLLEQQAYGPLRRFLAEDADLRKRFQLAAALADLYDQYQVYRADWLAAWERGEDVLVRSGGQREPLSEDQRWQACLWRALVQDVASEGQEVSKTQGRSAVHEMFLERVKAWPTEDPRPAGLPRRVTVFGISALPRQSLEVLHALSRWVQVLVCVHNPCQHHWADIVPDKHLLLAQSNRQRRRNGMPLELAEDELHLHAHALLAAWGRQGRDYIGLLDEYDSQDARTRYQPWFEEIRQRIDLFSSPGTQCLLNQLQDDILELRPLHETRAHWPAVEPEDESIRFHVAHSAQREVEVLHDRLLDAFNKDETLRPQDVIVMVPDVDTYAPHIRAVFGLLDGDDPRHIPFRIADLGRRRNDPLVDALARLLELPRGRLAASDVLGLLEVSALRRRFGIADEALPLLQRWIQGANVRWGLHAEHRASLDLPKTATAHTWLFGLRRMLLGYAVGATSPDWHDIEPFDEIGGLDAALLGPLVKLLDQLEATWRTLCEEATPAQWCARLRRLVADFFEAEGDDAYTLQELEEALAHWKGACDAARLDSALPLSVVAEHWLAQIEDDGHPQRFLGGAVTIGSLMPMRAIPFRQVYLLGMNDGDYPRTRTPMDFDLMGRDYRPGDRSRREDDRYLFLEALLSARERLHVSWVGRSINDNTARPPSVLVGQLRDHLAAGWGLAGHEQQPGALLQALTVEHRLQPFSLEYFTAESPAGLFTYAREWRLGDDGPREGAQSGQAAGELASLPRSEPLRLAELGRFLRHPVKAFFRERLKVDFGDDDPASVDQEPFDLDGLQKWGLWDELIGVQAQALRRGESAQGALQQGLQRMRRRGALPEAAFGAVMAQSLAKPMQDMFERYAQALARWPVVLEHDQVVSHHDKATGLSIDDRLHDLRSNAQGERARVVLESRDAVKKGSYQHHHLVAHWVAHVAGHLGGQRLTTLVVSKVGNVEFAPLDAAFAVAYVNALLKAWAEGMCRPLPLAAKTAFAWLQDRSAGKPKNSAPQVYEGDGYKTTGEIESCAYLQRAWPDYAALTASGEFASLAEELLRPLYQAAFKTEAGSSPTTAANPGEPA